MTDDRTTAATGDLNGVLEDLRALSGEIALAAVLDGGGDLLATTAAPSGVDRERLGAMLGAMAGLARRVARENGGSGFARARVKAEDGYVLLVGLRDGATLAATTGPEARVGLVMYDMKNAGAEIERSMAPGGTR